MAVKTNMFEGTAGVSVDSRKFAAESLVTAATGSATANSDLVFSLATLTRDAAPVVESLVAIAREDLQLTRAAIEEQDIFSPRVSPKSVSQSDLDSYQKSIAGRASVDAAVVREIVPALVPVTPKLPAPANNRVIPDIDAVVVELEPAGAVLDKFAATVVLSVPRSAVSEGRVKLVRLFRTEGSLDEGVAPLTQRGLSILSCESSSRSGDALANLALRADFDGGPGTVLAKIAPLDPILGVRVSSTSGSFSGVSTPQARAELAPYVDPTVVGSVDLSVARNPLFLRNIQVMVPDAVAGISEIPPAAGRFAALSDAERVGSQQASVVRENFVSGKGSEIVVDRPNTQGFREMVSFMPDATSQVSSRIVGDQIEFRVKDPSVRYGFTYRYYATTVDSNMSESPRSRVVSALVDGIRVPECPSSVVSRIVDAGVSLCIRTGDQLVEAFEVYRREFSAAKKRDGSLRNGFTFVGEVANDGKSGALFYDRSVVPGSSYEYRVYSVDVFGNKSERPTSERAFVPEKTSKRNDLQAPAVIAEHDAKTRRARVRASCSDQRVVSLFVTRRDLTLKQSVFSPPGQQSFQFFGNGRAGIPDPSLQDSQVSVAWNGHFPSREIDFVDTSAQLDHVYQYRVQGVDRFGNVTSCAFSRPVFVPRRAGVEPPVNVSASVSLNESGLPVGVRLSWQASSLDISAEDRVGNRDDLDATRVRTLYQVERLTEGESLWREFPMVEETSLFDAVKTSEAPDSPAFRPPLLEVNRRYSYRVAAYQTGSFISNFTFPVDVVVTAPVLAPTNFSVKSPDPKQLPYFVALNWDTPDFSAPVDKWELERAELNNFAAARLNPASATDVASLPFAPYREVYLEASRFRSRAVDKVGRGGARSALLAGQHHFVDLDVERGNTYFYRIRAVSAVSGEVSPWSYKGMKVTDETFEKKLLVLLSQEEKQELARSFAPLRLKSSVLTPRELTADSSISLRAGVFKRSVS